MRESTPRVVLLLLLIFAAGVTVGVTAERLWLSGEASGKDEDAADRDRRRGTVIEQFSVELGLSDAQEARIDTVLRHYRSRMHEMWREVRPRYRALMDSARAEIEAELTEEQVRQYRDLLERREERRKRRYGDEAERRSPDGGGAPAGGSSGEDASTSGTTPRRGPEAAKGPDSGATTGLISTPTPT